VTIDAVEARFTKPAELIGEAGETVAGVILDASDLTPEALVQLRRRGLDEVEIREDAARCEEAMDLRGQLSLAPVLEVVDGKGRDAASNGPCSASGSARSCRRSSIAAFAAKRSAARASIGSDESSPIPCA
jgi:hypothetical protein